MASNNSTVSPSAKRISLYNHAMNATDIYRVGGQGLNDPTFTRRATEGWDNEATTKVLARKLNKQIADLGHYSKLVERIPWDSHEVARDGVITSTVIPSTRRFQALVPHPAPIEPATTILDCCPEDLPSF